ncbi:MAG: hypothetical protein EOP06_03710 [Proteobacteria bacterium]|nr:MAG: hypothetical protein EOP06_03710 [Pseudomonadota bacterium]
MYKIGSKLIREIRCMKNSRSITEAKGWAPLPLMAMALNEYLLCRYLDSHLSEPHIVVISGYFLLFSRIVAPLLSYVWLERGVTCPGGHKGRLIRRLAVIVIGLILLGPAFLVLLSLYFSGLPAGFANSQALFAICKVLGISFETWLIIPGLLWVVTTLFFPWRVDAGDRSYILTK